MFWRMTKAVLILPGTALIYIPLLIQWLGNGWPFSGLIGGAPGWLLAVVLAAPAFALAIKTMLLFQKEGEGTPAPWDPPRKFVVSGPYRYMRNPMLTSVIMMILAEAAALSSVALLGWAVLFFFSTRPISPLWKSQDWSDVFAMHTDTTKRLCRDGYRMPAPTRHRNRADGIVSTQSVTSSRTAIITISIRPQVPHPERLEQAPEGKRTDYAGDCEYQPQLQVLGQCRVQPEDREDHDLRDHGDA
ncbi:MAG: hypothetical protein KDD78_12100, partial [Caldilineaceae bacterium]|nr:hypothetical protein [Caldilineaceae bacterium]